MKRALAACLVAVSVSACAERIEAPSAQVSAARFVADEPPSITLYTVINNRSEAGAHSALLINASQRVLFDPAGSWPQPESPEVNDVRFGMTDRMLVNFIDFQARETFRIEEQTLRLSPETAERILTLALQNGAVPKAQCARSIADLLREVPGFEGLPQTWFPRKLHDGFATLPGVTERRLRDNADPVESHGMTLAEAGPRPRF